MKLNIQRMMNDMLNDYAIKLFSETCGLVNPFKEENLQPHSIDLTLGGNFKVPIPEKYGEWAITDKKEGDIYNIYPNQFVLAHTQEFLNLPENIVGFICGKSSIARNFLIVESAGLADANFCGQITLELFSQGPWPLKLTVGMPICQVYFVSVEKPRLKDYKKSGHYNGQSGARESYLKL